MVEEIPREEAYEWLREGHWVRMGTIGHDGYPHVIPLGYWVRGDGDFVVNMRGQREMNIRRNPKVSLTFDTGSDWNSLKGVFIRGTARLVEGADELLQLTQEGARARGVPEDELPTEARPGRHFAIITPEKWFSWDNPRTRKPR